MIFGKKKYYMNKIDEAERSGDMLPGTAQRNRENYKSYKGCVAVAIPFLGAAVALQASKYAGTNQELIKALNPAEVTTSADETQPSLNIS